MVIGQLLGNLVAEGACQHFCFSSKQSKEMHFPVEYQYLLYLALCAFIFPPDLTCSRASRCTHKSCSLSANRVQGLQLQWMLSEVKSC